MLKLIQSIGANNETANNEPGCSVVTDRDIWYNLDIDLGKKLLFGVVDNENRVRKMFGR